MNKKRIMSAVMAGVMSLSLAAPAMASETVITGTYQDIVIDVEVPTEGTAQINPYGLPVEFTKKGAGAGKVSISGQQIVTAPLSIKNKTATPLDVYATVSGTGTGLTLASAAPAANSEEKEAFVYLQMKESAANGAAGDTLENTIIDEIVAWDQAYAAAKDVVVTDTAPAEKKMATLKAATMETDGSFKTYNAGSIALVRLAGNVVKKPTTAWAESDGFSATIAYTFSPYVAASVTLDKATLDLDAAGTTGGTTSGVLTATFDAGTTGLTVTKYDWASATTASASVTAGGTATATTTTVTAGTAGTSNVTVTATLSDGSTVTATCAVTVS